MARAMARDLTISTKTSIEMSKFLRGKTTAKAKAILQRVLEKKQAIPFTRFTNGVGHRAGVGIAAGRFPEKASQEFIKLIKNAEANAQTKGLNTELKIVHLLAHKGSNDYHYGRQSRRKYKRTHLEVVVEEMEEKKVEKKAAKKTPAPKVEKKVEVKKETPKVEDKKEEVKPVEVKKEEKETPKVEKKVEPKEEKPSQSETKKEDFDKLKEITKMSTK